jgi:hypothetical protein
LFPARSLTLPCGAFFLKKKHQAPDAIRFGAGSGYPHPALPLIARLRQSSRDQVAKTGMAERDKGDVLLLSSSHFSSIPLHHCSATMEGCDVRPILPKLKIRAVPAPRSVSLL